MVEFDEQELRAVVEDVNYPRLVGTKGERRVIEYVEKAFEDRGFAEVTKHEFTFSKYYGATMIQLLAFALFGFMLNFSILLLFNPLANLVLLGLFAVVAYFFLRWTRHPENLENQLTTTENLMVTIPAREKKRGTIVLSAHHDTKGQNFIVLWRAGLFLVGIVTGVINLLVVIITTILAFVQVDIPVALQVVGVATGFLAAVVFFALVFNGVNNKSSGPIDNGTGMAIVLELARALKHEGGLAHYDVICALFSAEEYGLMGSRYWLAEHGARFDPAKCYNINFDMVIDPLQYIAAGGFLKRAVNERLNKLFAQTAQDRGVEITGFWLPVGASTDRFNFSKAGWEAMDVCTRKAAYYAHSYNDDTLDKVDAAVLRQACEVTLACMKQLDDQAA